MGLQRVRPTEHLSFIHSWGKGRKLTLQSSAKCKLKPRDLIPVRIFTIKKTKTASVVKDVETLEPSGIFCEMHNDAAAGGRTLEPPVFYCGFWW